jgi:(p)ppGpp synthase/HD superfamily hydrolase
MHYSEGALAMQLTCDEIEFSQLHDVLNWEEAQSLARSAHATQTHLDGESKLTHVYAVSELAKGYALYVYGLRAGFEKKYLVEVCRIGGLLHEVVASGIDFERLTQAADKAVTELVVAITPDIRLPRPKRFYMYNNQVGLADDTAQIVALADLRHTVTSVAKIAKLKSFSWQTLNEYTREMREMLSVFYRIEKEPKIAAILREIKASIKAIEVVGQTKR